MGDPYAGVAPDTMARRAAIVAEFAGCWPGYQGQGFFSETVVTSSAGIAAALNALNISDLSRWHRIVLDSAQPTSSWTGSVDLRGSVADPAIHVVGHYFGGTRDFASAGGGVLIESSNPSSPVVITNGVSIRGCRGLEFRHIILAGALASAPYGAGSPVTLVAISSSSTYREGSVLVFGQGVKIGSKYRGVTDPLYYGVGIASTSAAAQIDLFGVAFNGVLTGFQGAGVRLLRTHNVDLQGVIGDGLIPLHQQSIAAINSAWDERQIWWSRLCTMRNMADHPSLSEEHTDFMQAGTSSDVGGYTILHEMDVAYAERVTGTDGSTLTFTGQPAAGASITIKGTTFQFVSAGATGNQILIGGTFSATLDAAVAAIKAAGLPGVSRVGLTGSTTLRADFDYDQFQAITRSTSPAANCSVGSPVRYTGGTQGFYNDDTTYPLDCLIINCIVAASDGNGGAMIQGVSRVERSTFIRPGALPPDAVSEVAGFSYSNDFEPHFRSSRIAGGAADHAVRNCVVGYVMNRAGSTTLYHSEDGTFTTANTTLELAGNRYVHFEKGRPPGTLAGDMLAGTFGTDAQGRVSFAFADDGAETPQEFRQRLFNTVKLSNVSDRATIGASDPADWPAGGGSAPAVGARGFLRRLRIRI